MTLVPSVEEMLVAYLGRFAPGDLIVVDTPIFEAGFMNSLLWMQLVLFIEQQFALSLGEEELQREHFVSVRCMAEMITRLQHD